MIVTNRNQVQRASAQMLPSRKIRVHFPLYLQVSATRVHRPKIWGQKQNTG